MIDIVYKHENYNYHLTGFLFYFFSSLLGAFFAYLLSLNPVTSSVNFLIFSYSSANTHIEFDKGFIN